MIARRRIPTRLSPGFTLVELMMVVLIIALLVAFTIPLIGDLVTQARRSATKTTVTKLHEILQKRLDAFERGFPEYFRSQWGRDYQPANPADVMFRKLTFRDKFWRNAGFGNDAGSSEDVSAAVLYKIVTELDFFGTAAEDAGQFNAAEFGEVDINGARQKVFIDSWGNPIVYYPYPTRLFKSDGSVIGSGDRASARYLFRSLLPDARLNEDPDDPFEILTTANYNEGNYHTFKTYHVPLIVSRGPDGNLGLYSRSDIANAGHLARVQTVEDLHDNITNHNIKAGDQ